MNRVSVVVETVTARDAGRRLLDAIGPTLVSLEQQTHRDLEILVVVDDAHDAEAIEIHEAHPSVRTVQAERRNYFVMKNCGARAATADIVAYLDGDCIAEPRWIEHLVARFEPDVALVAGRSSYPAVGGAGRTFTLSDFGAAAGDPDGRARGLLLSNVAFRREVLLSHPLEERLPRNGGCYLLYNRLRAEGARMLFEPQAVVTHGFDAPGFGFIRKHFDRGYDGMLAYRFDDHGDLRGTRLVRRMSGLAVLPITLRRLLQDWRRLFADRRDVGVIALPYYGLVLLTTRSIEAVGGIAASFRRRPARLGVTNPRPGAF